MMSTKRIAHAADQLQAAERALEELDRRQQAAEATVADAEALAEACKASYVDGVASGASPETMAKVRVALDAAERDFDLAVVAKNAFPLRIAAAERSVSQCRREHARLTLAAIKTVADQKFEQAMQGLERAASELAEFWRISNTASRVAGDAEMTNPVAIDPGPLQRSIEAALEAGEIFPSYQPRASVGSASLSALLTRAEALEARDRMKLATQPQEPPPPNAA